VHAVRRGDWLAGVTSWSRSIVCDDRQASEEPRLMTVASTLAETLNGIGSVRLCAVYIPTRPAGRPACAGATALHKLQSQR